MYEETCSQQVYGFFCFITKPGIMTKGIYSAICIAGMVLTVGSCDKTKGEPPEAVVFDNTIESPAGVKRGCNVCVDGML